MTWKKSVLVISEILGVFVNTLAADYKYSLCTRENLQQTTQLQLFKEQFLFAAYLKSTSNFEHFEKKDDPHRLFIFEIADYQRNG